MIEVLDTKNGSREWSELIRGLPDKFQDVFLFPGYARVYERIYGAPASLFLFRQAEDYAVHVVLRRPVHTLPFFSLHSGEKELFDCITPEYSGPVFVCEQERKETFAVDFWQAFAQFCAKENIIAEFGRLNPFYNSGEKFLSSIGAGVNRHVVAVDLTLSEDTLMRGFSKGNRGSINKARRSGVVIKQDFSGQALGDFYSLYSATMQRNCAGEFYRFSLSFFQDLFSELSGNILCFTAFHEGAAIASSIFLHNKDYIHYYFSGSSAQALPLCPNNLLLYEAIAWARAKGFKIFNLGGGYHNSGKDSLFAFKSSFSERKVPFCIYKRVHNDEVYGRLCREAESFRSGRPCDQDYFPLYRG